MKHEPTTTDILVAIQAFSQDVDQQLVAVRSEIGSIKNEVGSIKEQMVTKKDLDRKFREYETKMVSKEYLDEKLADHHSDIVNHVKKMVPIWVKSGA